MNILNDPKLKEQLKKEIKDESSNEREDYFNNLSLKEVEGAETGWPSGTTEAAIASKKQ